MVNINSEVSFTSCNNLFEIQKIFKFEMFLFQKDLVALLRKK